MDDDKKNQELLPTKELKSQLHRIHITTPVFDKLREIRVKKKLWDRGAVIEHLIEFYEEYDPTVRRLKVRIAELEKEIERIETEKQPPPR